MDPFNSITSISKLYTDQRELAAIWLNKPILTAGGRTMRIAPGSLVKIENGLLVDCIDKPSHKVLACYGTLINQFELTVIDLETNEPGQIRL